MTDRLRRLDALFAEKVLGLGPTQDQIAEVREGDHGEMIVVLIDGTELTMPIPVWYE